MFQVDVDGHRLEVKESVILDQRPNDLSTTVVTFRGAGALCVTVNDKNFVGRSEFVPTGRDVDRGEHGDDEQGNADKNQGFHHGGATAHLL